MKSQPPPETKASEERAVTLEPASWISGHARDIARNSLRFYEECAGKGGLVRGRVFYRTFFVVTGPQALEEVLLKKASCFHKPELLQELRWVFGDGLLTSEGDLWKQQRRIAQPTFHARHLAAYGDQVVAVTEAMVGKWRDGDTRDVHADLVDACLDSLGRMVFDTDFSADRAVVAEAARCVHMLAHSLSDFSRPSPIRFPFGEGARMRRAFRALQQLAERLIDQASPPGTGCGFANSLLRARDTTGAPLPRRLVRDEIVTMLLAGHDTAASAVSFALEFLARNPTIAAALEEELDRQLGAEAPTYADLERLPLLDDVILETYRLRPPTYRIGRTCIEACTILGETIPVGAQLICPQWAVHRSLRHYAMPEIFRPSRWTDDFAKALPRFAFFPFGGGPRTCIGNRVVMTENALMLACVMQRFRVAPAAGASSTPLFFGLSLVPEGGLKLQLERRPPRSEHRPSATRPLSSRRLSLELPEEPLE